MKKVIYILLGIFFLSSCKDDKYSDVNNSTEYFEYDYYVALSAYMNDDKKTELISPIEFDTPNPKSPFLSVKSYEKQVTKDYESVTYIVNEKNFIKLEVEMRRNKVYSYNNGSWYKLLCDRVKGKRNFMPETNGYNNVFYPIKDGDGNKITSKQAYIENIFSFYSLYSITYEDKVIYLNEKADDEGVWNHYLPEVEKHIGLEHYELFFDNDLNPVKMLIHLQQSKEVKEVIL